MVLISYNRALGTGGGARCEGTGGCHNGNDEDNQ